MLNTISFVEEKFLFTNENDFSTDNDFNNQSHLTRFLREDDELRSLLLWLVGLDESLHYKEAVDKESLQLSLLKSISEIDSLIEKQINEIIHTDQFQAIESSWRGLSYLIDQKESQDKEQNVKIKVLDCSWNTLTKDLNKAMEFDQSDFYKLIYTNEYDTPGGEPFGVLIGDYRVTHKQQKGTVTNDIDTLKDITRIAAAAFAPFITSVEASLFGVDDFSELGSVSNLEKIFTQIEYRKWQTLRVMEESRFLGLTLPHILMRTPYKNDGTRSQGFMFKEIIRNPQNEHLWGNAAFAFAGVLLRAFTESGWFGQIRGMRPGFRKKGLVCDLPVSQYDTDKYQKQKKPSVNLQIGDKAEKSLADSGFIPLSPVPGSDHLVFFSNASVQQPIEYDLLAATVNAKLSSMLQYILCVSRFAHYIKVLGREKIGSYLSAEICERELQKWLLQYTAIADSASDEFRSKYPLYSAQVKVKEVLGRPGHYYSIIQLQPHFQLDQMVSSIKLTTELTARI